MTYELACADVGVACSFVAQGETMDELMVDVAKHAKAEHGYTDEQLNDPETQKKVKAAVKES